MRHLTTLDYFLHEAATATAHDNLALVGRVEVLVPSSGLFAVEHAVVVERAIRRDFRQTVFVGDAARRVVPLSAFPFIFDVERFSELRAALVVRLVETESILSERVDGTSLTLLIAVS